MIKILAVGDICLQSNNNQHPFKNVINIFNDKDILFGNLEVVLSDKGSKPEKAFHLHTSSDKVRYLKDARFDVLNLANNHIMDLGPQGLNNTLDTLRKEGLFFIGISNQKFSEGYTVIEKNNTRVSFLGYCINGYKDDKHDIVINNLEENTIIKDILYARSISDIVAVSLHWGTENVFYPSPNQIKLARSFIDAGATLVLGHHPHVVQGIEAYKNGLIAYSLGNFQFEADSRKSIREETRQSIILSIHLNKNNVESYKIIPVKIDGNFSPYPLNNQGGETILNLIETISKPLRENTISTSWWFEEIAQEYLSGNMSAWILRIKKYGVRHFLQCLKWLISPFVINCYLGILRRKLIGHD